MRTSLLAADLGLTLARSKGVGGLRSLFAGGKAGFIYYPPTDLSHLFTTSVGSTNVAANDDPVGRIDDFSPNGNNALQATTNRRPLYKTNAGKPNFAFDGTDDCLVSGYYPNATAGLTMAVAFNDTGTATTSIALGGGTPTGNKRAFIGLTATGVLTIGWGEQVISSVATDLRSGNHVVLVQGTGATRTIWLDGVNVSANFGASTNFPDGSGGALTLAGRQNTVGGSPDLPMPGVITAAIAVAADVTPAQRDMIFTNFQGTF